MLGSPVRQKEPLYVLPIALALALAAFLGGALGLVWHELDSPADSEVVVTDEPQ